MRNCVSCASWVKLPPTILLFIGGHRFFRQARHTSMVSELSGQTSVTFSGFVAHTNNTPQKYPRYLVPRFGTYTYVFKAASQVEPPLTMPYTGAHKIVRHIDVTVYPIEMDRRPRTILVDRFQLAFRPSDQILGTPAVKPRTSPRVTLNNHRSHLQIRCPQGEE